MQILGIDVGGTGIKGALVDVQRGELSVDRQRILTPRPATPDAVIGVIQELVDHFDYSGPLGVGFPAAVLDGVVKTAANIDHTWIDYAGEAHISQVTGCPTKLLNDADAAGLAELRFGAGRDQPGVVFVFTLGTGIGSALFVDGRLVPNTELGHLYLPNQAHDAEYSASERARIELELSWEAWAANLDAYLHHIYGLFWPNLIILGGGGSKKIDKFLPLLTVPVKIVPAELGNEAGIVGAALATELLYASRV